ncbi:MAG: CHC2 zinc finger domain-containing protein [Defluviimonas denitrificans]
MGSAQSRTRPRATLELHAPSIREKTASFHVDDRKGYYYCFGCHAKGDAISFLKGGREHVLHGGGGGPGARGRDADARPRPA